MPRRRLLTWLGRLVLVLVGLVAGLVSVELIARTRVGTPNAWLLVNTPNWYDTSIFQPDRELAQVLKPGASGRFSTPEFDTVVAIAPAGHRGPALGEKGADELRVLTVGDSFTLGVQVAHEDGFQALLAKRLSADLGRPVTVVNAGVDGYGTGQATRYARRLAPAVQPDLVLLTFFLGNDFDDNRGFRPGSYPETVEALPSLLTEADRRWGWSAIYMHWSAWQKARQAADDPGLRRHRAAIGLFSDRADLEQSLPQSRDALRDFAALADELGIPAAVAVAPPSFALHEDDTAHALSMVGEPGAPAPDGPARAVLGAIPPGVAALDLTPVLREAGGRPYFIFDGHWNERGHRVVAESLAPVISAALEAGPRAPRPAGSPAPPRGPVPR